ncbi:MAG: monovalent cation:proton antiporter family protein [Cyclobacteriaceae bacterium]
MTNSLIIQIIGFGIVAIASFQIAGYLKKINLPLITGLIVTGIVAGSSILNFIPRESINQLRFLNDIALAIIAFSAGSELYLKELRSRIKSIQWMTFAQVTVVFILSSILIYLASASIPFLNDLPQMSRLAVSLMFGAIFVARSPSSAIAIIGEMRASGPFTKTAVGVTVLIDVVVIILFTICFAVAKAVVNGTAIDFTFTWVLALELLLSGLVGMALSKLLLIPFSFRAHRYIKAVLLVLIGYSVYALSAYLRSWSQNMFSHEFSLEPLLICIIGSFLLTNNSRHRIEFSVLLKKISPIIYIVFFTLTGASLSMQVFVSVLGVAFLFFGFRIVTMFLGSLVGVALARDDKSYRWIAWMPHITQAGVALGLTTVVAKAFPGWGAEFEAVIISIVVINQLVGPPLFRWSINKVKESHLRHAKPEFDGIKDAYIFGLESQSIALAKQLKENNWQSRIVTLDQNIDNRQVDDLNIISIKELSLDELRKLELERADAVVCMLSDEENLTITEMVYENVGTQDIIVRLNERENMEKFHKLGALIIDPSTAMVSLLDHFVRSPNATSLLLGMDKSQDTLDIEITNRDIHGMTLRDLRLPTDVIILSVKRKGQMIISHGYTRLRMKDIVTMVGSPKSLVEVRTKFSGF